jgi:hypothetical protein
MSKSQREVKSGFSKEGRKLCLPATCSDAGGPRIFNMQQQTRRTVYLPPGRLISESCESAGMNWILEVYGLAINFESQQ